MLPGKQSRLVIAVLLVLGFLCPGFAAAEQPTPKAQRERSLRSTKDKSRVPVDDRPMRMRVKTPEGILVVYDAASPLGVDKGCSGYLAYWLSTANMTTFVFPQVLENEGDLSTALLALKRDLGVDLEALAGANDRVNRVLRAPGVTTGGGPTWEPATLTRAVEFMGFDPGDYPDLDRPGEGGTAQECNPYNSCGISSIGPPGNCDSPGDLARDALAIASGCCPGDGGGDGGGGSGDGGDSCPCCIGAAASEAEGLGSSPGGTATGANCCVCNDGNPCTQDLCDSNCQPYHLPDTGPACGPNADRVCCDGICCAAGSTCCNDECCPSGSYCSCGTHDYRDGWCCPHGKKYCDGACRTLGCNLSLSSGTGKPCETVQLTLTGDCWPEECCLTDARFLYSAADFPPGHENIEPWVSLPWWEGYPGILWCEGGAYSQSMDVYINIDAPPGPVTILVWATSTDGTVLCSAQATLTVQSVVGGIQASSINQDSPTNATWQTLAEGAPVYGGSEASTADNLRLTVQPGPGVVSNISWSASSLGGWASWSPPQFGPGATTWNVGDLLNPHPGEVMFEAYVWYTDGTEQCFNFKSEIGVRTDDVIVVGWIDGTNVPLNPAGVTAQIVAIMPPAGLPVPSSFDCNTFVSDLYFNDNTPNGINPLTGLDRTYILNWLFKFADNANPSTVIPGGDFRNASDTFQDESEVSAFYGLKTNYKLFNRLQIKYLDGGVPQVVRPPTTGIGDTTNPCGPWWPALAVYPGQSGDANGPPAIVLSNRVTLINDGSPDAGAIRAFNTLTGNGVTGTPVFWENIGSKIQFWLNGATSGTITVQPYPTYYVYRNGKRVTTIPQAAQPIGNFVTNPYPFGTVECSTPLRGTTPGGRCGDAESPADSSARVPPYIVP